MSGSHRLTKSRNIKRTASRRETGNGAAFLNLPLSAWIY